MSSSRDHAPSTSGTPAESGALAILDIIQIAPPHKWGGCFAVVDEVKPWGCQAYVSVPANDGSPPGRAFIRLDASEFERVGARAIWVAQ